MKSKLSINKIKLLVIEDASDQRELIVETLEDHFGRGTVVGVGSRAEAMDQPLDKFDLIGFPGGFRKSRCCRTMFSRRP